MTDAPALPIPEPPVPVLDPWIVVARVAHDLSRDATKTEFTGARWTDAVRAAVQLLEALGVGAMIPDTEEEDPGSRSGG